LSYFWRKISIMTSLQKQDLLPIFDKMHDWKLLSNEIWLSLKGHGESGQVKIDIVTQFPVIVNSSQSKRIYQRQQEYIESLKLNLQHPQVCAVHCHLYISIASRTVEGQHIIPFIWRTVASSFSFTFHACLFDNIAHNSVCKSEQRGEAK
jgi:hypothetical protein